MKKPSIATILVLVACASTAPRVSGPTLAPVDEAVRDPTLVVFRQQLLSAVRAHDEAALVAALDPHVRTSFGSGGGAKDFKPLWNELEFVLTHGGTFRGDRFWAPYVYSAWPEQYDPFEHLAVVGKDVPLRDAEKKIIATLSYDIVKRLPDVGHVRTFDGHEGWVDPKFLYSPVGYRAGLVKRDGEWLIEAFVAGD